MPEPGDSLHERVELTDDVGVIRDLGTEDPQDDLAVDAGLPRQMDGTVASVGVLLQQLVTAEVTGGSAAQGRVVHGDAALERDEIGIRVESEFAHRAAVAGGDPEGLGLAA